MQDEKRRRPFQLSADPEQRQKLADLLEQVVEGRVHTVNALREAEKWADSHQNAVSAALHTLMQFHIYQDMRSKDSEFDEDFRHSLRLHISNLRR